MSIIVPYHNDKVFFCGLVQSLKHFLDDWFELVVVQNGDSDDLTAILDDVPNHQLFSFEKRVFPSVARNKGVELADCEVLVFLDSDIKISESWALEIKRLLNDDKASTRLLLTGDSYHSSSNPTWIENAWFEPIYHRSTNYLSGGNIVSNQLTLRKVGGFSEILETGEDVDFCKRCNQAGVETAFNKRFYVYHEGFPRNLSSFVKRESWHGKSDFISFRRVRASKVAIATLIFILGHFFAGLGLIFLSNFLLIGGLSLVLLPVVLNTLNKVSIKKGKLFAQACTLSYFYFVGRTYSIYRRFFD